MKHFVRLLTVLVLTIALFSCGGGNDVDKNAITATILAPNGSKTITIGNGEAEELTGSTYSFTIRLNNATFRTDLSNSQLESEDGQTIKVNSDDINSWIIPQGNTYGLSFKLSQINENVQNLKADSIVIWVQGRANKTTTETIRVSIPTEWIEPNENIPAPSSTRITASGTTLKYNLKFNQPSITIDTASSGSVINGEINKSLEYTFNIKLNNCTADDIDNFEEIILPKIEGLTPSGVSIDGGTGIKITIKGTPKAESTVALQIKDLGVLDYLNVNTKISELNTGISYRIVDPNKSINVSDLLVSLSNNKFTAPSFTQGYEAWAVLINDTATTINKPAVPSLNNMMINYDLKSINGVNDDVARRMHRPYESMILSPSWESRDNTRIIDQQTSRDVTRAHSNYSVGDTEKFWVSSSDGTTIANSGKRFKQVTAILKAKNGPVSLSDGSKRYVLVWADNTLRNTSDATFGIPTDAQYKQIADIFLTDGKDDIYGIVTSTFGSDIGLYNGSKNGEMTGFADDLEAINILYTDIDGVGLPGTGVSYTGGFYGSSDYFPDEGNGWFTNGGYQPNFTKTNNRPMFYMHAYASGNKEFASALTTLAHEFQHLVHDQYWNGNLKNRKNDANRNSYITETFSTASEDLTANFLYQKTNEAVDGPFSVGYNKNDKGYLDSTVSGYNNAIINGRGPYALSVFNSNGMQSADKDMNSNASWYNSLMDYGKDAVLAHYLIVNYGKKFFQEYQKLNSSSANNDDINSVLKAINSASGNNYTMEQFLKNYGSTLLLSNIDSNGYGLSIPYAYNKKGYYNVDGYKVGSVNLWQYRETGNSSVYGFKSYSGSKLYPYSTSFVKLLDSVKSGDNTVSSFSPGSVKYQVVLVPKNN